MKAHSHRYKLHANSTKSPHQTLTQPPRPGVSHRRWKQPRNGRTRGGGQITTSNPKHSAQTRSEAATTIRANPVLRVSQRGNTPDSISPVRASPPSASGRADPDPRYGAGSRDRNAAIRTGHKGGFHMREELRLGSIHHSLPGCQSLQNSWFTLRFESITRDF